MESSRRSKRVTPTSRSNLVAAALLPIGLVALFAFGGQVALTPIVLAIEWILARVAKGGVMIAWSVLAGVLAGEYIYLLIDLRTELNALLAVVAGLVVAVILTFVYLATTGGRRSDGQTSARHE
jgi:hypothetical protein